MTSNQRPVPTISIITVCRNSAATIGRTIASVVAQKNNGIEYLVIDGASNDATLDVIKSYGEHIDVLISEPDQGIADAFNKGLALASGDIIGLINADDTLPPGSLERVRRFFTTHPETMVLHGDVLLGTDSQIIKRIKPPSRWWYPWRLVLFNHPAAFVRHSVYRKYGLFDTSYSIAMDVEMFLRWSIHGVTIDYLPEVLAHMQAGGISGRRAREGYRQVRHALVRYGFSPTLANLQYYGKVLVDSGLGFKNSLCRRLADMTGNSVHNSKQGTASGNAPNI